MSNNNFFSFKIITGGLIVAIVVVLSFLAFCQKAIDLLDITGIRLLQDPEDIFESGNIIISKEHILGLDLFGRDMFSRVAYSMATFLVTALISVGIALVGGTSIGVIEAYFYKNWTLKIEKYHLLNVGDIVDGLNKVIASFPQIVVIILLWKYFGEMNIYYIMAAFGIFNIPKVGEKVKAKVRYLLSEGFVEAAKALGISPYKILGKHILWYQMRYIFLVEAAYIMADVILFETSLSFLGYGTNDITLGNIMAKGNNVFIAELDSIDSVTLTELIKSFFMTKELWSTLTCPSLVILFTMLGFYLLADGLKDRLFHRKGR